MQGRLEREAGVMAYKYRQNKGRKREQLNSKYLTLSILHSELVSTEGVERDLHLERDELSDLKNKCSDLEAEKQKLINEMRDLQRNKEEERNEENEQNPTYFSSSFSSLLQQRRPYCTNFYLA